MASAYKRKGRRSYTVKYTVNGIIGTIRGYPEKGVSLTLGRNIEKLASARAQGEPIKGGLFEWVNSLERRFRLELVKLGLLLSGSGGVDKSLEGHLADYVADLEARGRDSMYCYNMEHRLRKLFKDCGWATFANIQGRDFQTWRSHQSGKLAPRTLNQYLETVQGFLGWCVAGKRLSESPLADVAPADETKKRRKRRAFTLDELERLLATCGDRALCYKTALYCQLRRADVRALRWADVDLDTLPPYLLTRAETSKGKRQSRSAVQLASRVQKTAPNRGIGNHR